MDWNGWHSAAQARGDGLRPDLREGLERAAWRKATVVELEDYRRDLPAIGISDIASPCTVIPFLVPAKPRNVAMSKPRNNGLKPRQSRAKNLSRASRSQATQQPE